jgi:CDP-diacylglycerol---serine O-phosphatidyltransferase
MTKHIPNILTSINLVCGFLAIVLSFQSDTLIYAPLLIFAATIIDFSDGFAARMLDAHSSLGKQLDSLADMVSFGLAPGILAFQLVILSINAETVDQKYLYYAFLVLPALIPLFSALRLAKFNIDENQTDSFLGLATPSSAVLIASTLLVYLTTDNIGLQNLILNKTAIVLLIIIDSYLMVSNLPMFSLKFKSASFKANKTQYIFIGFSVVLFCLLRQYALPLIICSYIIASLFMWSLKMKSTD